MGILATILVIGSFIMATAKQKAASRRNLKKARRAKRKKTRK